MEGATDVAVQVDSEADRCTPISLVFQDISYSVVTKAGTQVGAVYGWDPVLLQLLIDARKLAHTSGSAHTSGFRYCWTRCRGTASLAP